MARQSMLFAFLFFLSMNISLANSNGVNLFIPDDSFSCQNNSLNKTRFRSFSIMDIPEVMAYVNHYECNGQLGAITIYSTSGEDMGNLEISLDGGETFQASSPDNFNNLILLNVPAGVYELYVRLAMDPDSTNQRYIGLIEVLVASQVDLDKDGYTKCEDINDKDPCLPADCDLAQGVGCDLFIEKSDYEWCHFEDLLNPAELSIGIKVDDVEGYVSYQWSNGDTSSTTFVSPIADSYYHVIVSDQSGCVLRDSVYVKVLFIPYVDIHINHQSCTGTLGSIVLFSPIGESLNHLQLSLDQGETFQDAIFDNFGNIVLFGLDLGDYSISIRHKDYMQCFKELGTFTVADERFFDEDEDGILKCEDEDDTDECVPIVCEICDELSLSGFESPDDSWLTLSENVEFSTEQQESGDQSVKLSFGGSYIESEVYSVDNQQSIKLSLMVYPLNLEPNEGIQLSISTDGGTSFTVVDEWVSLVDFHNDEWFELSHRASIEDGIDDLQYRLTLISSDFSDFIFIDNISVEFCELDYTESSQIVCGLINYDDVDAFLDFWSFDGDDASISTNYAQSGQFSYHLQDGNGAASSIISNPFSTDGVGVLSIYFHYTLVSMELREFFALELSIDGGATYNRIQSWVSGEFENGIPYQAAVDIPINRSAENLRLRFTNYANSQFDHVYFDDIKIEYCEDSSKRSDPQDAELDIEYEKETPSDSPELNLGLQPIDSGLVNVSTNTNSLVSIYPNPTTDYINLTLSLAETVTELLQFKVKDASGQTIIQGSVQKQATATVDVSILPAGIYYIQLYDEQKLHASHKLIKI